MEMLNDLYPLMVGIFMLFGLISILYILYNLLIYMTAYEYQVIQTAKNGITKGIINLLLLAGLNYAINKIRKSGGVVQEQSIKQELSAGIWITIIIVAVLIVLFLVLLFIHNRMVTEPITDREITRESTINENESPKEECVEEPVLLQRNRRKITLDSYTSNPTKGEKKNEGPS